MRGNPKFLEQGKASGEIILRFLLSHTFSTKNILQAVSNLSNNGIWNQLKRLQQQGFITYHEYDAPFKGKLKIYGITLHGVHYITSEHEVPNDIKRFEPSHFRFANFQHYLDTQLFNIWAIKEGYTFYSTKDFYLDAKDSGDKRADVVILKDNQYIAIEIERNPKSKLRYTEILINYFKGLKKGTFQKVWYVMPDEKQKSSIQRVIKSIKSVKMKGELTSREVTLTDAHWDFFEFMVHPFYLNK